MTSAIKRTIYAAHVRLPTETSLYHEVGGTSTRCLNLNTVTAPIADHQRSTKGWFMRLWELRCRNNPGAHRVPDEFHPVVDPKLRSDVGPVAHYRPLAHVKEIGDFPARISLDHQLEHLLLAFSEETPTIVR